MDARTHNQQTQYELRKQLVRLRKRGLANREVSEIVGISEAHASTIWLKYQKGEIGGDQAWQTWASRWRSARFWGRIRSRCPEHAGGQGAHSTETAVCPLDPRCCMSGSEEKLPY